MNIFLVMCCLPVVVGLFFLADWWRDRRHDRTDPGWDLPIDSPSSLHLHRTRSRHTSAKHRQGAQPIRPRVVRMNPPEPLELED